MTEGDRVRTFISDGNGGGIWLYGTVKRNPPSASTTSFWDDRHLYVWVRWDQGHESYALKRHIRRVSALEELADAAEC